MERSSVRTGRAAVALAALAALAGCAGEGATGSPSGDDPRGGGGAGPGAAGGSGGPNFEIVIGDTWRAEADPVSLARIEGFIAGALAPLDGLPGLLPRTVRVVYDRCGQANAFHDGFTATITICHELTEQALATFSAEDFGTAVEDPPPQLETNRNLALSAIGFTLYHEVAHALDFQRDLRVAGNLESAMDSIATVIAVETGRELYASAGAVLFSGQLPSLADRHGNGTDRAGDIGCWTLGGSTFAQAVTADPGVVDPFAAAGRDCVGAYARQRAAVRAWLPGLARLDATDGRADGAPALRFEPGTSWLQGEGADPGTRDRVERFFADTFAPLAGASFGDGGPVAVVYDTCGEARSGHDPGTGTILLCSELLDHAYRYAVDFIDATDAAGYALALDQAYGSLAFSLYHELGHALDGPGGYGSPDVERASDAMAAVLLVERGKWMTAYVEALTLAFDPPPAQRELHGAAGIGPGSRPDELLCLVVGGDAALRADPRFEFLTKDYVADERGCVARYARARDAVRARLGFTPPSGR